MPLEQPSSEQSRTVKRRWHLRRDGGLIEAHGPSEPLHSEWWLEVIGVKPVAEEVMEAQADLQAALGWFRLAAQQQEIERSDLIEGRLDRSLARLHRLLASLDRPMYEPSTHPAIDPTTRI